MATLKYRGTGNPLKVTAPAGGVTSGVGVLIGEMFGVAVNTAAAGASAEIGTEGIYTLAKTAPLVIDEGDALFWDDSAKEVNKTATNQKFVGYAVEGGAASAATEVSVLLVQSIDTAAGEYPA